MSMVTRCAALGGDGAFCQAAFDVGDGAVGETRLCGSGTHRWEWTGQSWSVDLAYQPVPAQAA